MSLSIGIVGLPNVGKSTLFNALLKRQLAYTANFPFATIDPNVGIVPVPEPRLRQLAKIIEKSEGILPPEVPATVKFVDIAGLVKDAHKGEGLGNKFLSHIREVSAIAHVVRVFKDENVSREGSINPKTDFEIIKTELDLADLQSIERRKEKNPPSRKTSERQGKIEEPLPLFKDKPILVVLNIDEEDLKNTDALEKKYAQEFGLQQDQMIAICAKTEAELAELSEEYQKQYLESLGIGYSALDSFVRKTFATLGLITFLTAGKKEVRAWSIKRGTTAQKAAGEIHTDFIKGFIKAEVVDFEDFITSGGWKGARESGKTRLEGRDYIIQDGDVVEFKINV